MSLFQDFLDQHPAVSRIEPGQRCSAQKSPKTVAHLYQDRRCKKNTTYWYDGPAPDWTVAGRWDRPMCRAHLVSQALVQDWLRFRRQSGSQVSQPPTTP